MSFKDVILPGIVIADLFKNSLVQNDVVLKDLTDIPEYSNQSKPITSFQYLGSNLNKIAVIVSYADTVYLPEEHLTFLANVLKACHLTIADIAIINIAMQRVVFDDLKNSLQPDKIIFFEVQPAEIQIDLELSYYLLHSYQDLMLLYIPALEKMTQNNEEGKFNKSKLWLCLKELFRVG